MKNIVETTFLILEILIVAVIIFYLSFQLATVMKMVATFLIYWFFNVYYE